MGVGSLLSLHESLEAAIISGRHLYLLSHLTNQGPLFSGQPVPVILGFDHHKAHLPVPVFSGRGLFWMASELNPLFLSWNVFSLAVCVIRQAEEVVSSTIHSFMTHLSSSCLRSRQCAECWGCHGDQHRTFSPAFLVYCFRMNHTRGGTCNTI